MISHEKTGVLSLELSYLLHRAPRQRKHYAQHTRLPVALRGCQRPALRHVVAGSILASTLKRLNPLLKAEAYAITYTTTL